MNKERLQHLVEVLEEVAKQPETRFDLASWFFPTTSINFEERFNNIPPSETLSIPHKCGAVACACGYAGLDPQFRAEGFKTLPNGLILYSTEEGRDYKGWTAVEAFFDLWDDTAQYLFCSDAYMAKETKDVKTVIARLREFIETRRVPNPWFAYGEMGDGEVDGYEEDKDEEDDE